MNWDTTPTISLEDLTDAASLQTRTDRKYILTRGQAEQILPDLAADALVLSIDGIRSFNYSSVYFDTPQLDSFHLAAHPRRRRFKIRTRSYLDSGLCFLEVKTEGARSQTVKERIEHPLKRRTRLDNNSLKYIATTLRSDLGQCPIIVEDLSPVIESAYSRTTLYLPASNSRLTIDEHLQWKDPQTGNVLECQEVIVETKAASNAGPADKMLWQRGIRPARISKFTTGMTLLHSDLPSNRWHHSTKHKITTHPYPEHQE